MESLRNIEQFGNGAAGVQINDFANRILKITEESEN